MNAAPRPSRWRPLVRLAKSLRRRMQTWTGARATRLEGGRELFCERPFRWLEVSGVQLRGEAHVCCPSWLEMPIGDLSRQSVDDVWNSAAAQKIRRSILDGSFRYCNASLCPFLASGMSPVHRRAEVTDPELRLAIDRNLTRLPWGPREINCAFDRSCNLSCPSCREDLIVEKDAAAEIEAIQRRLRTEGLADAEVLYITGSGDPFGSPFFRRWLESMSEAEIRGLRRIHLHTNGLLWNRRSWERLPAHVRERVKTTEISIDATTAETYAVNRRGGRFETLLDNLAFISSLRQAGELDWVGVSFVVQANNFAEMPAFVELAKRLGFDLVLFNRLLDWGTFSADEYERRAVHAPSHARHAELRAVLQDAVFDDPIVHLGNLGEFRGAAGRGPQVGFSRLRVAERSS